MFSPLSLLWKVLIAYTLVDGWLQFVTGGNIKIVAWSDIMVGTAIPQEAVIVAAIVAVLVSAILLYLARWSAYQDFLNNQTKKKAEAAKNGVLEEYLKTAKDEKFSKYAILGIVFGTAIVSAVAVLASGIITNKFIDDASIEYYALVAFGLAFALSLLFNVFVEWYVSGGCNKLNRLVLDTFVKVAQTEEGKKAALDVFKSTCADFGLFDEKKIDKLYELVDGNAKSPSFGVLLEAIKTKEGA